MRGCTTSIPLVEVMILEHGALVLRIHFFIWHVSFPVGSKNLDVSLLKKNHIEMTGDGEDSGDSSRDKDDLENRCVLTITRTRQQSDPHHLNHRFINLRGGFWKNQFRTSRMTTSVRKSSLTIGMVEGPTSPRIVTRKEHTKTYVDVDHCTVNTFTINTPFFTLLSPLYPPNPSGISFTRHIKNLGNNI